MPASQAASAGREPGCQTPGSRRRTQGTSQRARARRHARQSCGQHKRQWHAGVGASPSRTILGQPTNQLFFSSTKKTRHAINGSEFHVSDPARRRQTLARAGTRSAAYGTPETQGRQRRAQLAPPALCWHNQVRACPLACAAGDPGPGFSALDVPGSIHLHPLNAQPAAAMHPPFPPAAIVYLCRSVCGFEGAPH